MEKQKQEINAETIGGQFEAGVINFGADYNGNLLKAGDRVQSVYAQYEPNNIGTITKDGYIIYDDEPETEYQILDSRYLIKMEFKNLREK